MLFALDRRPLEAALQQAEANLQRDMAQAANAESQAKRYQDLARRGIATREQVDTTRTGGDGARRDGRGRSRGRRERESQLQYATITAPLVRPHRRADGARGQPRARQRHDAARRHQSGRRRSTCRSAIPEARLPELKRYMARARAAWKPRRPTKTERRQRAHHVRRQHRRSDDRHDQDQGIVSERRPPALARAVRRTSTVTLTTDAGRDRRADGRRSERPAGDVRVRRQAGQDGRYAARRRRRARAADERSSRAA